MRLLHPEIEIEPGRRGQQPGGEGVGNGSATLRLENTSTLENAYVVRVLCDDPYWQADWGTLKALPAPEVSDGRASPEPDQYGPRRSWVKVFVPRGGTRDVILDFSLPQNPTARAGAYPLRVIVESFVSGTSRRGARFVELPLRATVRPFYKWDVDVSPEEGRRAGRMFRRRRTFEALVTNQSNDWLYCDLHLPRHKDLLLEAPSVRVAIPPPEPEEEKLVRVVPLRVATKLKLWRGDAVDQPIPVSATRVDAPSVAPREDGADAVVPFNLASLAQLRDLDAHSGSNGNGNGHANGNGRSASTYGGSAVAMGASGAVVARETGDIAQAPADRALHYHPPFPGSIGGLFSGTVRTISGVIFLGIGLIGAWIVGSILFEKFYREGVIAEPLVAQVAPGGDLTIGGKFLIGSKVFINNSEESVPLKRRATSASSPLAREVLRAVKPGDRQYLTIRVDPRYNGQKIRISVQRAGFFSFLSPLLPRYEARTLVQVGLPPSVGPVRVAITGGKYTAGSNFVIRFTGGPKLKAAPKRVNIGAAQAKLVAWKPDSIVATIPSNAPPGTMPVSVVASDGGKISIGGQVEVLAGPTNSNAQGGALPSAALPDGAAGTVAAGAGGATAGAAGGSGGASAGGADGAGGGSDPAMPMLPPPALAPMPLQPLPAPAPLPQIPLAPLPKAPAPAIPVASAPPIPVATPVVIPAAPPAASPSAAASPAPSAAASPAPSAAASPSPSASLASEEARRAALARQAQGLGLDSVPLIGAARRPAVESARQEREKERREKGF